MVSAIGQPSFKCFSPMKERYLSGGAGLQLHQRWAAPRSCLAAREQEARYPWRQEEGNGLVPCAHHLWISLEPTTNTPEQQVPLENQSHLWVPGAWAPSSARDTQTAFHGCTSLPQRLQGAGRPRSSTLKDAKREEEFLQSGGQLTGSSTQRFGYLEGGGWGEPLWAPRDEAGSQRPAPFLRNSQAPGSPVATAGGGSPSADTVHDSRSLFLPHKVPRTSHRFSVGWTGNCTPDTL